jgi:demethylmenaquinone methyltransferase/2-methoxy-6-polyprenyl-1,4-benzoquinol methylase
MSNAYYEPGSERANKVNALFDSIAHRYDLINDIQSMGLHRLWKRRLIRLAAVRPGMRALDVCCGTGDIAYALADKGASVTGLDFSAAMLAAAARRKWRGNRDNSHRPTFIQSDALHLPFEANYFDAATVGYGLRNLSDWQAGLLEMHRVIKPGGRLLVLDFGKPDNRLWRFFYYTYLRAIVPVYGWVFSRNASAYAYILESLLHYPAQRGVASMMTSLKCHDIRIINLWGGMMSINYGVK